MTNALERSPDCFRVGGLVRDKLLGIESSDNDYVVIGLSEQDMIDLGYVRVGKDFPVFLDKETGSQFALARRERKIANGYSGFSISTSDVTLEEDLKRRDLTINSMALDWTGKLIDPYGGVSDIEKKTLRHTSEAFVEDPIRVLRLARFRAKFGPEWKIHQTTKLLVDTMHFELQFLQEDRVAIEVTKVMHDKKSNPALFFRTLDELGVLGIIFPKIADMKNYREGSKWHQEPNVFEHTMTMLDMARHEKPILKYMILYHDIAKPLCRKLYGNGAGHDSSELVQEHGLIDMKLTSKELQFILFNIEVHQRVFKVFDGMTHRKIATLLESFRKNMQLFDLVLKCSEYDKVGAIQLAPRSDDNFYKKLQTLTAMFLEVVEYSPVEYIKVHGSTNVKQHIHNVNISIVKRHMDKYYGIVDFIIDEYELFKIRNKV